MKFLVRALYIFAVRRDALCSSVPTAGHLKQRCDSLIFQQAETSRQGEYDDPVHLSAATSSVTRCQIEVPCNKSVHPASSWITYNLNFVTHVALWNYVTVINMNRNMTHKNCAAVYTSRTYSCGTIWRAGIVPNYVV